MNSKGVKFKLDQIVNRCVDCGRDLYVQEDNEENVKIGHEIYLKSKNK